MIKNAIADAEDKVFLTGEKVMRLHEKVTSAEEELLMAKYDLDSIKTTLYNLNIDLQEAEAIASTQAPTLQSPVGTKYKWTDKANPQNYRVAIQTKDGILQVKSVNNGVAEVHEDCGCSPCWESENNAPWRPRKPLKKHFFPDRAAWEATLPLYTGNIVITPAPITDKALKALCMEPLKAWGDALKLKELEARFPGGVFVLSSPKTQFEISYKHVDNVFHKIYYAKIDTSFFNFSDFCGTMKTQLMVEWHGLYIDLSHLF